MDPCQQLSYRWRLHATCSQGEVSVLDPALIESYKAAVYLVRDTNRRVAFRIENESADLDRLLDARSSRTAVFLTAHNPGSQVLSPVENDLAHEELLKELRNVGLCWLTGDGVDPGGEWIAETSVMILGIDRIAGATLARQFGQNAYVWIQRGEPPQLVLTQRENLP